MVYDPNERFMTAFVERKQIANNLNAHASEYKEVFGDWISLSHRDARLTGKFCREYVRGHEVWDMHCSETSESYTLEILNQLMDDLCWMIMGKRDIGNYSTWA